MKKELLYQSLQRLKKIRVLYFVELFHALVFLLFAITSAVIYNKEYMPYPGKLLGIVIVLFLITFISAIVISAVYKQIFDKLLDDKTIKEDPKFAKMEKLVEAGRWIPFIGIYNVFYYIKYINKVTS